VLFRSGSRPLTPDDAYVSRSTFSHHKGPTSRQNGFGSFTIFENRQHRKPFSLHHFRGFFKRKAPASRIFQGLMVQNRDGYPSHSGPPKVPELNRRAGRPSLPKKIREGLGGPGNIFGVGEGVAKKCLSLPDPPPPNWSFRRQNRFLGGGVGQGQSLGPGSRKYFWEG
jgi:hypothetical protein